MTTFTWEGTSGGDSINTFDLYQKNPSDCPEEGDAPESSKDAAGQISFIGDSLLDMVDPAALESSLYYSSRPYGSDTFSNCSIQMQLMDKGYDIGKNAAKGSAVIGQDAVNWALISGGQIVANISDLYNTLKSSLSANEFDTLIMTGGIGNILNRPDGEDPVDWSNRTADQMEILVKSILADNLWNKIVIIGYAISTKHPRNLIQILHNKFIDLDDNNSKVEFINTDYLYEQYAGDDRALRESLFGDDGNHGGVEGHRLVADSFVTLMDREPEPTYLPYTPPSSDDVNGKVIIGSKKDDTLKGKKKDDYIDAKNGDDFLYGKRGHDVLLGKKGIDRLEGRGGNDFLNGGQNDDVLTGGKGADVFKLSKGTDTIRDFDVNEGDKIAIPEEFIDQFIISTGPGDAYVEVDGYGKLVLYGYDQELVGPINPEVFLRYI